ncbi:MAG: hypothetical protein H6648_01925 [Caldilineae bacterium]|nr:hypothetical protein [Chloroflexota bacterium]MCB9175889.1 hypothetical protein [Caldilineae bacterium]
MQHAQRALVGILLILTSIAALYFGSPVRNATIEPNMALVYAFVVLFALGFVLLAMGLLAFEGYPGLLSSFVLYGILGALAMVLRYVMFEGTWSLADGGDPRFWWQLVGRALTWPIEIVRWTGIFGYRLGV